MQIQKKHCLHTNQDLFPFYCISLERNLLCFAFPNQVGFVCEVALINYNKATDSVVRLLYAKAKKELKTNSKKC